MSDKDDPATRSYRTPPIIAPARQSFYILAEGQQRRRALPAWRAEPLINRAAGREWCLAHAVASEI